MGMQSVKTDRNNSILFLALLCLIYYLISFYPYNSSSRRAVDVNSREKIYIEVTEGDDSTILGLSNPEDLDKIADIYNIDSVLRNGNKVLLEGGNGTISGRISGLKSLSLGVPLGLNSAGAEDLKALPGIGDKLAERIVSYRDATGGFTSVEELQNLEGIGEKKLSALRTLVSLD